MIGEKRESNENCFDVNENGGTPLQNASSPPRKRKVPGSPKAIHEEKSPSFVMEQAIEKVNNPCLSSINDTSLSKIAASSESVKLNIGGVVFHTRVSTLMKDPDSFLASLVTGKVKGYKNDDGLYCLDRDGTRFKHVLNFLRDGVIPEKVFNEMGEELTIEANFYEIGSMRKALGLLAQKKDASLKEVSQGKKDSQWVEMARIITAKVDTLIENEKKIHDICIGNQNVMEDSFKKLDNSMKSELEKHANSYDSEAKHFLKIEQSMKLHMDESFERYRKDVFIENGNNLEEMKNFVESSVKSALIKHENNLEMELKAHNNRSLCAFSNSPILSEHREYRDKLHQWLIQTRNTGNIKLIQQFNRGFDNEIFHFTCDKKPPTLILIKSTDGSIFGGFTTCFWKQGCIELPYFDSGAFVFSLKHPCHKTPFLKTSVGGCVMVKSHYGPAFVNEDKTPFEFELKVNNNEGIAGVSGAYSLKRFDDGDYPEDADLNIAGVATFEVARLEVYTIKNNVNSDSSSSDED